MLTAHKADFFKNSNDALKDGICKSSAFKWLNMTTGSLLCNLLCTRVFPTNPEQVYSTQRCISSNSQLPVRE